eukprot:ctg_1874.g475
MGHALATVGGFCVGDEPAVVDHQRLSRNYRAGDPGRGTATDAARARQCGPTARLSPRAPAAVRGRRRQQRCVTADMSAGARRSRAGTHRAGAASGAGNRPRAGSPHRPQPLSRGDALRRQRREQRGRLVRVWRRRRAQPGRGHHRRAMRRLHDATAKVAAATAQGLAVPGAFNTDALRQLVLERLWLIIRERLVRHGVWASVPQQLPSEHLLLPPALALHVSAAHTREMLEDAANIVADTAAAVLARPPLSLGDLCK